MLNPQTALRVDEYIDQRPMSWFQILVVVQCGLIVFLDGFDTQAIGYVAPAIISEWHVARELLSPVFAAGLIGLMIGACTLGPVADRIGRRPVLLASTVFFGLCSLLTSQAASLQSLLIIRFITGLGLGGAMPNAVALTSEYTPHRVSATTVMFMFCGFSMGAAFGGFAAAALIEQFGWRSVFVLGGGVPCVLFLLMLVTLPESIRYLVLCGNRGAEVARILSRIDPSGVEAGTPVLSVEQHKSDAFLVKQLFTERRAVVTLALWVVFFMTLVDLYFVSNWMPTLIRDTGVGLNRAVLTTSMFHVGGAVATLVLARPFDRFPPFRTLAAVYVVAAVMLVLIAIAGTTVTLLTATVFAAGFCVIGGQVGTIALASALYPTPIRSTGVGWGLGIGRLGSVFGPTFAGLLIALGWHTKSMFLLAAIPALAACAGALTIDVFRRRS